MNDLRIQLFNDDCFNVLKNMEDESVDLVLIDPPYGTIKSLGNGASPIYSKRNLEWDIKLDIDKMFKEITRVLKKRGRAIIFCQEPFTNELYNAPKQLKFNMRAIWVKNRTGNALNSKKTLVNMYEDILIYTKITSAIENKELREYSKLFFNGLTEKELTELCNGRYKHFKHSDGIQFRICTKEIYELISNRFDLKEKPFYKTYEELKILDTDGKMPTFNLNGKTQKSNVFQYNKPSKTQHPTQKPVELIQDLIETFSNKDDLVVDFTMGSGTTKIACLNSDRRFIGVELDKEYFDIAVNRLN